MQKFEQQIGKVSGKVELLPILHSCSAYDFRAILESSKLKPSPCDVFIGQEYLYAYYGIPSYRKQFTESTGHPAFFPVCFIFRSQELPPPIRMFPFDSGAFCKLDEVREKHFYPDMELEQFELKPQLEVATRIVEKYFSSNKNYVLKQSSKSVNEVDSTNFEEYSYVSLLTDESLSKLDNRVATIELIYNREIKLSIKTLEQVIIPSKFLDSEDIRKSLKNLGINNPYKYQMVKGNPNEYFGQIYNQYIEHLETYSYY